MYDNEIIHTCGGIIAPRVPRKLGTCGAIIPPRVWIISLSYNQSSDNTILSRKCLNSQKSAALQKLPIYSDFNLLCPIHLLLLPTFFLSLRKRKEFDDTKRIFSFQFIRRKHSQLPPIQNFFCGPQKTLRQT